MSRHAESDTLHARARAIVAAFERGQAMPEPFDRLAVDLARFQARTIPGYARLCAARSADPTQFAQASDAPAVPTDAFKVAHVFAFEAHEARGLFRTSGTTVGARGTHLFRDVRTYDAAALAFGRVMLGADSTCVVLVVGPSPTEAPDSSLAHMCGLFACSLAAPSDLPTYFLHDGELDATGLRTRVRALSPSTPARVLATSFALVHLLDEMNGETLPLPKGSIVMQTGGFKGRLREIAPDTLRRATAALFTIDERAVVGEYGMTELSSQFWEGTGVFPSARQGVYFEPPWARVVPVDATTLAPVGAGEIGLARIEDLANIDSAFAVVTQDRVRRVEGGFELLGRDSGAAPRGCSIAIDEILSGETKR